MSEVVVVSLEEYEARRGKLHEAAAAGKLTLDMIEEATGYVYKPTGKKPKPFNLGFQCFMRYFENAVPLSFGALYGFLNKVLPREGVGKQAYDYKIFRRLTRQERRQLLMDGVLRHGIVPPKSLVNQARMAGIADEEVSNWVMEWINLYEDQDKLLHATHPLVVILRYGSGVNFDRNETAWWTCMPVADRHKAVAAIVQKRPDVLFSRNNELPGDAKHDAWRYLGLAPADIARRAAQTMPSFTGVKASELFAHLSSGEIAALLDRLSVDLPVRVICQAIRVMIERDKPQEAILFTQYLPGAHVAADVSEAAELYRQSLTFGAELVELAVKIRKGTIEAFVRNGRVVQTLHSDERGLCVEHNGHTYVPNKGGREQVGFTSGEKVVFKPINEAQKGKFYTSHVVPMISLGRDTA